MNVKIEFDKQQLEILNHALMELPYKLSAPLVGHINTQLQEQIKIKKATEIATENKLQGDK